MPCFLLTVNVKPFSFYAKKHDWSVIKMYDWLPTNYPPDLVQIIRDYRIKKGLEGLAEDI